MHAIEENCFNYCYLEKLCFVVVAISTNRRNKDSKLLLYGIGFSMEITNFVRCIGLHFWCGNNIYLIIKIIIYN
jgi:hypothetical protein